MGTTSLHQTFVSSSHIGYYHQLAQVCHPLNIFSGELGLDHCHNSCCNAAYTSLQTVPVNYVVVVLTPQLWLCHTLCGIHFLDLLVHTLAHFLHELSLLIRCLRDPAGLLAWPWLMRPKKQSIKPYTYTTVASPAVVTLDLPYQEWAIFFYDQWPTHFTGKATALLDLIWVTCWYHRQTHLLFTWTLNCHSYFDVRLRTYLTICYLYCFKPSLLTKLISVWHFLSQNPRCYVKENNIWWDHHNASKTAGHTCHVPNNALHDAVSCFAV